MWSVVGTVFLFLFIFLTGFAALLDLSNNEDKYNPYLTLNIITVFVALTPFAHFVYSYKTFIAITMFSCIVISICAILTGIFKNSFHLSYNIVRILIILFIFTLWLI